MFLFSAIHCALRTACGIYGRTVDNPSIVAAIGAVKGIEELSG